MPPASSSSCAPARFAPRWCARSAGPVETLTPTVVIKARTGDGTYVTDVRVTVDGATLTEQLGAELAATASTASGTSARGARS